jgi:hypothetical protein
MLDPTMIAAPIYIKTSCQSLKRSLQRLSAWCESYAMAASKVSTFRACGQLRFLGLWITGTRLAYRLIPLEYRREMTYAQASRMRLATKLVPENR